MRLLVALLAWFLRGVLTSRGSLAPETPALLDWATAAWRSECRAFPAT
jgi:hypothetical protein